MSKPVVTCLYCDNLVDVDDAYQSVTGWVRNGGDGTFELTETGTAFMCEVCAGKPRSDVCLDCGNSVDLDAAYQSVSGWVQEGGEAIELKTRHSAFMCEPCVAKLAHPLLRMRGGQT